MNEQKRKPVGILLTVILIAALLTICLELGLSYLRPDTPNSLPKHLIHFGIMFALLGGAVLLCLFCPPFKKLWAWIDQHILDKETRPIAIDIIYAVIAGLMLLHHFYVLLYYPVIPTGATKLAPIWIVFAALTVLLSKSWREISFRLSAVFLFFAFERLYIGKYSLSSENAVYFFSAIYALFICLGVYSTLRPSMWKVFLKIMCCLFALFTLIVSFAGLCMAWSGTAVKNLVGTSVHYDIGRLGIFSVATITASVLSSGSIMTLVGISLSKHKWSKILYLFTLIIILRTNSFTDARASFISNAFMISGVICVSLWTLYHNRERKKHSKKRTISIVLLLLFCYGLCFYGAVEGQRLLGLQFFRIRNSRGLISIANAEEPPTEMALIPEATPEPPGLNQRDVWGINSGDINEVLSDRFASWEKGLAFIHEHPETALYGLSVNGSVAPIVGREDHSHNILLQTLLEGGIPALLLYLSIVFYGVYHAFRLWARRNVPFWQRILPLPVFSILLWEMAECLTHFSYGHPPMTLFWFFLGATITVSKSLGKAPKATEQPAIPAESAVTETGE